MEMKDIMLPGGILVGLLIVLGIITIMLAGTVTDKDTKVTDLNTSVISLIDQVNLLTQDNLGVKTNYNNLLATYNTTTASLTAAQIQVTTLTTQTTSLTNEINNLNANNTSIRADYNTYIANTTQLRIDYNLLSIDRNNLWRDNNGLRFDNNFMVFDRNNLLLDKNNLLTSRTDMNVRAHRLYNYANTCYLAVKCIDNNVFCATKYGYDLNNLVGVAQYNLQILTLRTTCVTAIDGNINDYNYFS
jgi:hypothetical protein